MTDSETKLKLAYETKIKIPSDAFSDSEIEIINRRLRAMAVLNDSRRMAIERKFLYSVTADATLPLQLVMAAMVKHRVHVEYAQNATQLFDSYRRRDQTDAVALKEFREHISVSNNSLRADLVRDMNAVAYEGDISFADAYRNFLPLFVLLDYSSAYTLGSVLHKPKMCVIDCRDFLGKAKTVPGFSPEDWTFVNMVVQRAYPEVEAAIKARGNEITLQGFTDSMFDTLADEMDKKIYGRKGGALGAEALAAEFEDALTKKFPKAAAKIPEHKFQLWARTEGAIIQNDALMRVGTENDMDGKQWTAIIDNRTRQGHIDNDADGVIPVDATFSDGSTDAGSGSVSPFNCRCVCGPALLTEAQKKKIAASTAKPKPTKTQPKPVQQAAIPEPPAVTPKPETEVVPFGKEDINAVAPNKIKADIPKNATDDDKWDIMQELAGKQKSVTGEEFEAALDVYKGSDFDVINKIMRGDNIDLSSANAAYRNKINNTIEKMSDYFNNAPLDKVVVLDGNAVVYRGIDGWTKYGEDLVSKLESTGEGLVLRDTAFTSTSLDLKIAKKFAEDDVNTSVILKYEVPDGNRVLVGNKAEREIILPPGQSWQVASVKNVDGNLIATVRPVADEAVATTTQLNVAAEIEIKPSGANSLPSTIFDEVVPFGKDTKFTYPDNDSFPAISKEQDAAFKPALQAAVGKYKDDVGYRQINNFLRTGKGTKETAKHVDELVAYFDEAVDGSIYLGQETELYRAITVYNDASAAFAESISSLKVGDNFVDAGLMSTSMDATQMEFFGMGKGAVRMTIDAPAGTKYLGIKPTIQEVVLAPNTELRLVKKTLASDGKYDMHFEISKTSKTTAEIPDIPERPIYNKVGDTRVSPDGLDEQIYVGNDNWVRIGPAPKNVTEIEIKPSGANSLPSTIFDGLADTQKINVPDNSVIDPMLWKKHLTDVQKDAITQYTGADYRYINNNLRRGWFKNPELLDDAKYVASPQFQNAKKMADELTAYFDEVGTGVYTSSDMTVYRGLRFDNEKALQKFLSQNVEGTVSSDAAFMSTTMDRKVAEGYFGDDVVIEISVPKGTKVAPALKTDEAELILRNDSPLKIGKITKDADGRIRVQAELLTAEKTAVVRTVDNVPVVTPKLELVQRELALDRAEDLMSAVLDAEDEYEGDAILAALSKEFKLDSLPTVVSKADFDAYIKNTNSLNGWRGVSDSDYVTEFMSGDFYGGEGMYGNGTYVAYGSERSEDVALAFAAGDEDGVMRLAMKAEARIIDYEDLLVEWKDNDFKKKANAIREWRKTRKGPAPVDGVNGRNAETLLHYYEAIGDDPGRYALMQGYDAVVIKGRGVGTGFGTSIEHKSEQFIILNRGMVIAEEVGV